MRPISSEVSLPMENGKLPSIKDILPGMSLSKAQSLNLSTQSSLNQQEGFPEKDIKLTSVTLQPSH
jgi:hypothetical protein